MPFPETLSFCWFSLNRWCRALALALAQKLSLFLSSLSLSSSRIWRSPAVGSEISLSGFDILLSLELAHNLLQESRKVGYYLSIVLFRFLTPFFLLQISSRFTNFMCLFTWGQLWFGFAYIYPWTCLMLSNLTQLSFHLWEERETSHCPLWYMFIPWKLKMWLYVFHAVSKYHGLMMWYPPIGV